MLVLLLSASRAHQEAFFVEGVTERVLECCVSPEIPTASALQPYGRQGSATVQPDASDLELKQLAWCAASSLCSHPDSCALAIERGFLRALMMHSDPLGDVDVHEAWGLTQRDILSRLAPGFLLRTVPHCLDEFLEAGGASLLVSIVGSIRSAGASPPFDLYCAPGARTAPISARLCRRTTEPGPLAGLQVCPQPPGPPNRPG